MFYSFTCRNSQNMSTDIAILLLSDRKNILNYVSVELRRKNHVEMKIVLKTTILGLVTDGYISKEMNVRELAQERCSFRVVSEHR